MNVAFLTKSADPNTGSTRVRVAAYLDSFQRAGVCTRILPRHNLTNRMRHARYVARALGVARWADVVVLQKPNQSEALVDLLARINRRLWVDIDDAVWALPRSVPPTEASRRSMETLAQRTWHAVRRSERTLVGCGHLAHSVRTAVPGAHVCILPSPVDLADYPSAKTHVQKQPVAVAWIGSSGNLSDLDIVAGPIRKLSQTGQIRLNVISDRPPDLDFEFDFRPWSIQHQVDLLYACDIGIMPTHGDERSLGRCGYKAIQYMAAGLPVVCSPRGAGAEIVIHGQTGYHAANPEDWRSRLAQLAVDVHLRGALGRAGRERAAVAYSVQINALRYLDLLRRPIA